MSFSRASVTGMVSEAVPPDAPMVTYVPAGTVPPVFQNRKRTLLRLLSGSLAVTDSVMLVLPTVTPAPGPGVQAPPGFETPLVGSDGLRL